MLVDATAIGLGVLAICGVALSYWRTAPGQLLKGHEDTQRVVSELHAAYTSCETEIERLRTSWRVQSQELEKYLDSIDSRARRLSATRSQERRRQAGGDNGDEAPQAPLDPEATLAALRKQAGIG